MSAAKKDDIKKTKLASGISKDAMKKQILQHLLSRAGRTKK